MACRIFYDYRLLTIALSFIFSTCVFSQVQDPTVNPPEKIVQIPNQKNDQAIETLLTKAFSKMPGTAAVRVHVDSGVVLLEGPVPTQKDSEWIHKLVDRLPNVVAVIDKMEVSVPDFADFKPVWTETHKLLDRLKKLLPSILFAVLVLFLFYFISDWFHQGVRKAWGQKINNPFLLSTVTRLTLVPIWLAIFYLALRLLGLSTLGATIIGGTGVVGIILGFAFKGIVENYLAGLLLASRSPFTRGDLILIGAYKGYVQNLNMRGTTIIDLNGNLILIPNIMVIQSVVENQTANPKTRTAFTVGIGYRDSISKAQELIINAVSQVKGVLADPAPSVVVQDLGRTCVELRVRLWFNVKEDREMRVKSQAMIQTKETLLAHGFEIPNETREMIFASPLKIENIQSKSDENTDTQAKKSQIQQKAAANLIEPESVNAARDPSAEDLLKQAEKNPLPTNSSVTDLLKPN